MLLCFNPLFIGTSFVTHAPKILLARHLVFQSPIHRDLFCYTANEKVIHIGDPSFNPLFIGTSFVTIAVFCLLCFAS